MDERSNELWPLHLVEFLTQCLNGSHRLLLVKAGYLTRIGPFSGVVASLARI